MTRATHRRPKRRDSVFVRIGLPGPPPNGHIIGVSDRSSAFALAPAQVVERFGEFADAGAQHVIFSLRDVDEVSKLELLGREVFPHLRGP